MTVCGSGYLSLTDDGREVGEDVLVSDICLDQRWGSDGLPETNASYLDMIEGVFEEAASKLLRRAREQH